MEPAELAESPRRNDVEEDVKIVDEAPPVWAVVRGEWAFVADFLLQRGFERVEITSSRDLVTAFAKTFAFLHSASSQTAQDIVAAIVTEETRHSLKALAEAAADKFRVQLSLFEVNSPQPQKGEFELIETAVSPQELLDGSSLTSSSSQQQDGSQVQKYHFFIDSNGRISALIPSDRIFPVWHPRALDEPLQRLQHYQNVVAECDRTLRSDEDWIRTYITHLKQLLSGAESSAKKAQAPVFIGFVGASRLGKSALINTLLKHPLLPATNGDVCTASACSIGYTSSDKFICKLTLQTPESLDAILQEYRDNRELKRSLRRERDESDNPEQIEKEIKDLEAIIERTKALLVALVGNHLKSICSAKPSKDAREKWHAAKELARRRNDNVRYECDDIHELADIIQPFVSSAPILRPDQVVGDIPLWPLVKHVAVWGKFDVLSGGAVLLDLPGVSDTNAFRREQASAYLKMCTHLVHVVNGTNPQATEFLSILHTTKHVNSALLSKMIVVVPQCISRQQRPDLRSNWQSNDAVTAPSRKVDELCRMWIVTRIHKFQKALQGAKLEACADAPVLAVDAFEASFIEKTFDHIVGVDAREELEDDNFLGRLDNPREAQIEALRMFIRQMSSSRTLHLSELLSQLAAFQKYAEELVERGPKSLIEPGTIDVDSVTSKFLALVEAEQKNFAAEMSTLCTNMRNLITQAVPDATRRTGDYYSDLRGRMAWNTFLAHATRSGVFREDWNLAMSQHLQQSMNMTTDACGSRYLTATFDAMTKIIQIYRNLLEEVKETNPRLKNLIPRLLLPLERQRGLKRDALAKYPEQAAIVQAARDLARPEYDAICWVETGPGRFDRMVRAARPMGNSVHPKIADILRSATTLLLNSSRDQLLSFAQFVETEAQLLLHQLTPDLVQMFKMCNAIRKLSGAIKLKLPAGPAPSEDNDIEETINVNFINRLGHHDIDVDGVPYDFVCPVLHELMVWPVRANDGRLYEASTLVKLLEGKGVSPMNRRIELDPSLCALNQEMLEKIQQWLETPAGREFLESDAGREYLKRKAEQPPCPF